MNKLDPRVDATKETGTTAGSSTLPSHYSGVASTSSRTTDPAQHSSSTSHTGRDAAVAGGVGGAAYEAEKRHHDQSLGNPGHSAITGDASRPTTGPHSSNVANNADPVVDSDRSRDHHYGRDAGVAGGAGAAAYGAEQHHHDKNLDKAERKHEKEFEKETKKEHKQDVKQATHEDKAERKYEKELEKEHKQDVKEAKHEDKQAKKESKGGLLSFLRKFLLTPAKTSY